MSTLDWAVFAALGMYALATFVKWYLTRNWRQFYISPKDLVLPRLCPVCLSTNVTEKVEEKSSERQTANYIVARELRWWNVQVPHCAVCKAKLEKADLVGFALGAVCVVAAFFVFPPNEPSYILFCYILFGYPAYLVLTTLKKGIVFGFPNSNQISARVRRPEYFHAMVAATHAVPPKKRVIAL
jgi:hypothetical protein